MRVLLTTRGSTGHLLPLVPYGRALATAGHDVLVAAQHQHSANVERTGLALATFDDPPPEEWMPLLDHFGSLGLDEANAAMIGEFFAGIDTRASLPGLRRIVDDFRPDLVLRESWEFGSTLVAELNDIPIARVGLGLATVEELSVRLAAPTVEPMRAELELPPDPDGRRLAESPYLTAVPEELDDATALPPRLTRRFGAEVTAGPDAADELAQWSPPGDAPLVYVTFGSVTPAEHLPYFPVLYRQVIDALSRLDARVLVTVGQDRDPAELGEVPAHVRVERWVPHDAAVRGAAVVVCHGGYGSTLGTLRHGVPLVVLPLFSIDQWANAAAVQRVGAGIAHDADRGTRRVLGLPDEETMRSLGGSVRRVIARASYRKAAERVGAAFGALPPVTSAVDVLVELAAAPERTPLVPG